MIDFETIPHLDMDKAEKTRTEAIMATGNIILREKHKQAVCNLQNGRYARLQFRKELFKKIDSRADLSLHGVTFTTEEIAAIQSVRDIQYRILQGYAKLIFQYANRNKTKLEGMRFGDIYDEAVITAINCIFCYANTEIRFITFLHSSLKRKFFNLIGSCKPLSHWTNKEKSLFGRFQKVKKEAEQENGAKEPVTFDELVTTMDLSFEDQQALQSMLAKVVSQSDMSTDDKAPDLGVAVVKETLEPDVREALENAPQNEWEKVVLQAWMDSPPDENGWKSEVARQNINPLTKKAYTRAAALGTLRRVLDRVKDQVFSKELAA